MKLDLNKPTIWIIAGIVAIVWYLGREEPVIAGGSDDLLLGGGGASSRGRSLSPREAAEGVTLTTMPVGDRVRYVEPPPSTRQPGDPVDVPRTRPIGLPVEKPVTM